MKKFFSSLLLLAGASLCALEITLPAKPLPSEKTAAQELRSYLERTVDGKLKIGGRAINRILLGDTPETRAAGIDGRALKTDAYVIRSSGDDLFIAGGGQSGTLYGVYAFLENQIGIRWWTPAEEFVPGKRRLELPALDIRFEFPVIQRDIYRDHAVLPDGGKWAARNRLNRNGDLGISTIYGGSSCNFGGPYFVHTFDLYLPKSLAEEHPEYFAVFQGKRQPGKLGQLCLSNEGMRREFLARLKKRILADESAAKAKGNPVPRIYDVSPNDVGFFCECAECRALNSREESDAGTLIAFVNGMAREIGKLRPDILISTTAYTNTVKPPKTLRPESNVLIRFCYTPKCMAIPLDTASNREYLDNVRKWKGLSPELYVWIYGITYQVHGYPLPNEQFMANDVRQFYENGIRYFFFEHEDSHIADMYALKVWMEAKLAENPEADGRALLKIFMDGYYGPEAGEWILKARRLIAESAREKCRAMGIMAGINAFNYLTFEVVEACHGFFDRAAECAAGDPVKSRRVAEARLSLDRFTLAAVQRLYKEFRESGGDSAEFPFDRKKIAARIRKIYPAYLRKLNPVVFRQHSDAMNKELDGLAMLPLESRLPARFAGLPPEDVWDFTADKMQLHNKNLKVVKDPAAESGMAVRFLTSPERKENPFNAGMYLYREKKIPVKRGIGPKENAGSVGRYQWYKLFTVKVPKDFSYIYLLSRWEIQMPLVDLSKTMPGAEYDVYLSLKYQGPLYGGKGENAVFAERVVMVRKHSITLR